jgi:rare lipoprotein A
MLKKPLILIFIIVLAGSCSVTKDKKETVGYKFYQKGNASWYGPGFNGKKTASGEVFNMNKLTAAHRKLPFGTKVRVTNLNNNKSVIVIINDRGPFKKGRVIDLSKKAAEMIGLIKDGVAPVRIEIRN